MTNKCPKCGFEYGEFDIYCSRCGEKLSETVKKDDKKEILPDDTLLDETYTKSLELFSSPDTDSDDKQKQAPKREFGYSEADFNSSLDKSYFDSFVFNFAIVLIIVCSILVSFSFVIIDKQKNNKLQLQYKNLLNNPQQIPELKEPSDFDELIENISEVENFLTLYLKFSDDTTEKKERVFISYLNEMNKLTHITSENMVKDEYDRCYKIKTPDDARYCSAKFNKKFKTIGVTTLPSYNTVYLFPDYSVINKKYSKYLSSALFEYLNLRSKYPEPLSLGTELYIKPKKLANKIYDFEKLYNSTTSAYVKNDLEEQIYNNFRKFIFTPSIYDTTTQEMNISFKSAFK